MACLQIYQKLLSLATLSLSSFKFKKGITSVDEIGILT